MVHVIEPGAQTALSGLTLAGACLIAATTVAGARLAARRPGHREILFATSAGALLVLAGFHLVPDAWAGADASRLWPPLVPVAAMGALMISGLAARVGCSCREHAQQASGAAMAAALVLHRFLEGSAVALASSATVAVALAVHAFAEGLAAGTLLGAQPRRMAGWLAAMSLSPVISAVTTMAFPVPEAAEPVLLAVAAGVIAQAAWVSARAAFAGRHDGPRQSSRAAATVTVAVVVTALAVHAAG